MIEYQNITLKPITPTKINKFLGLNKSTIGEVELKLGEATECQNFRITEGYELEKMEGYISALTDVGTGRVRGSWCGNLNGSKLLLYNRGGKLYKYDFTNNPSLIATISDVATEFFYFYGKVYILYGANYKSYDGTTFQNVDGYVPLVAINAPPAGGGTPYEQINLLTGKKHMTFIADGTSKTFVLPEQSLASIYAIYLNGTDITSATSVYFFSKNLETGQILITIGRNANGDPLAANSVVDIYWNKTATENRNYIVKSKHSFIYGGESDTRVFLYGNPDNHNREYYSGIAQIPTAEYFPANNYNDIGDKQFGITGMERQYDRRIIHTEKSTYYGTIESSYDELGVLNTSFPVYPLNSEKGNIAPGQTVVLLNNPVTICSDGIYEWLSSNVRDERNAKNISKRVQSDFDKLDMTTAKTIDWEARGEFWICIPSAAKCWIYNYRNDVWYVRTNVTADNFIIIDNNLWFAAASSGIWYKFDKEERQDRGFLKIDALYELGFYGFNADWLKKNIRRIWVNVKPETKTYLDLKYQTDRTGLVDIGTIERNIMDFAHMDFAHMSFLYDLNVKPFRLKLKAKKFAFFKLILRSDKKIERATVLSIDIKATMGGEIK